MIDSCLSPHQLRGCCVYCPLVGLCHLLTLNPDPGKLTCTYAHVRNNWAHKQANGYMQERFCLTFSETHTHPDLKTTSLPRPPPQLNCWAYGAYLQQIKRGLIRKPAILLDLRRAFSLFHSLQTIFGARSPLNVAQYVAGEDWGHYCKFIWEGVPPNTPSNTHMRLNTRNLSGPRPFRKSFWLQSWCAFINCPLNWYQKVTIRVWKQKEALMKHRAAIHLQITMFSCLDSHHARPY